MFGMREIGGWWAGDGTVTGDRYGNVMREDS